MIIALRGTGTTSSFAAAYRSKASSLLSPVRVSRFCFPSSQARFGRDSKWNPNIGIPSIKKTLLSILPRAAHFELVNLKRRSAMSGSGTFKVVVTRNIPECALKVTDCQSS